MTNQMSHIWRHAKDTIRAKVPTQRAAASLQEAGNRPMERTIPDAHKDRLIEAGYVREVVARSGGICALALTGAELKRLQSGK